MGVTAVLRTAVSGWVDRFVAVVCCCGLPAGSWVTVIMHEMATGAKSFF